MRLEHYSDGKLVENRLYYDALEMKQQLGIVPSLEQAEA
jgi:hypothetical protein